MSPLAVPATHGRYKYLRRRWHLSCFPWIVPLQLPYFLFVICESIRLWLIWKTNAMNLCAACLFLRQMTFLMKCCRAVRRINLNISCFCLGYNSVIMCNNVKKKFSRLPLIHTLPPKQHSKRQVMLLIFQHHPIQVSPEKRKSMWILCTR